MGHLDSVSYVLPSLRNLISCARTQPAPARKSKGATLRDKSKKNVLQRLTGSRYGVTTQVQCAGVDDLSPAASCQGKQAAVLGLPAVLWMNTNMSSCCEELASVALTCT